MRVKHTPGPWSVGHTRKQNVHSCLQPKFETAIHFGEAKNRGNCLAIVGMGGDGALRTDADSTEANARLIAAAPALLAACEAALWALRTEDEMPSQMSAIRRTAAVRQLREAIAEAKGIGEDEEIAATHREDDEYQI